MRWVQAARTNLKRALSTAVDGTQAPTFRRLLPVDRRVIYRGVEYNTSKSNSGTLIQNRSTNKNDRKIVQQLCTCGWTMRAQCYTVTQPTAASYECHHSLSVSYVMQSDILRETMYFGHLFLWKFLHQRTPMHNGTCIYIYIYTVSIYTVGTICQFHMSCKVIYGQMAAYRHLCRQVVHQKPVPFTARSMQN